MAIGSAFENDFSNAASLQLGYVGFSNCLSISYLFLQVRLFASLTLRM